MKKRLLGTLTLAMLFISTISIAQITYESGSPTSWGVFKSTIDELPVVKMPTFDVEARLAEDAINDVNKSGPWRFGYEFETSFSTHNSGVWHDMDNGERIWRLAVKSKDALSMNVIFDEYNLVPGDQVFIYNEDRSDVLGPFNHLNNKEWNGLATMPINGETIIIELRQVSPAATQQSSLKIGQVTHGYRDIFGYAKRIYEKGLGDSGSCNNNVICPEGDPWRCQISSVGIIVVNGSGSCTGTVLNNHAQDERPLFLTANHCMGGNVSNWVFRFNWDSPTCTPTANGPTNQSVSGASVLAQDAGSDVALLELSSNIPAGYNVYYSGWDASGTFPTNQTGIHHPSGDVKKISFDNDAAVHGTMSGADCWQILDWEDGTTEPGSSGSGLWDQNKRIIGQLFGGQASCSNNVNDFYGRLDVSWNGGGSSSTRVKDYLDPNNTGVLVLDGLGSGACAGTTYDDDASIQSIDGIDDSYCNESSITPSVTLKNNGNLTLTAVDIDYDFNSGASAGTIPWTGSLASGATTTVALPTFTLASGANSLTVTTDSPNGNTDLNTSNDSKTSTFNSVSNGVMVTIDIVQDDYGSETTWEINDGSTILYTGGPYSDGNDGVLVTADVCLELDQCYNFVIFDEYGDGICCQYGNGSYSVGNNGVVYASGGTFTNQESTNFCVTLGLNENVLAGVKVYPNPTNGLVTIDLSELKGSDAKVTVLSITGAVIAQQNVVNALSQFDLSKEANGIYFVEVSTEAGKAVYKLNLRK
mgnify:CR=1 FL=1